MYSKPQFVDVVLFFFCMAILLGTCLFVQGCCRFCKVAPEIVKVPQPCELPVGPGELPTPERAEQCPDKHVCYDIPNAALLAQRDGMLKQWIREAKARCDAKKTEP